MNAPYLNVKEAAAIYDTVNICKTFYGKEKSLNGWYTSFRDFAADEKQTFFKSRTAGNSHLAYCNQDSADNVDFVFQAYSFGVRFYAPVMCDAINSIVVSPANMAESNVAWWLFDLPKHCGIDFRVQQDVIVENTCLATPAGYGPRGGGGSQPATDITGPFPNQTPWKVTTGTIGDPIIDNRFPFPEPIEIARNTSIEANLYVSAYARSIMASLNGPSDWVLPTAEQATQPPAQGDYFSVPSRFGIQVSLFGVRQVQQRGQYHAPGAIQAE